jgi:hypothetical protein
MAIDLKLIDKLLADYKKPEDIIGENGLLKQLTKAVLERAMQAVPRGMDAAWCASSVTDANQSPQQRTGRRL